MKKYIGLSILMLSIASCGPMQKALKTDDHEYKKEVANQFYEKKKYRNAIRLYEQLETVYRANPKAEDMFFNFSMATYMTKDYELSSPRFKNFAATYPRSERREEALLMEIKSGLAMSPVYSLDQRVTLEVIEKLQKFIDQYPGSNYVFEANTIMLDLNKKLEKKAYENAKQLNTIGEYTRNYNAAIVALDNFIYDFPGTEYKEDALFYKFDSAYKLAMNSVRYKMEERLKTAKSMHDVLIRFNAETKYKNQATSMLENINTELAKFSK